MTGGININIAQLFLVRDLLNESGLIDVGAQLIAGNVMGAYQSFIAKKGTLNIVVRTAISYGFMELIASAFPGARRRIPILTDKLTVQAI